MPAPTLMQQHRITMPTTTHIIMLDLTGASEPSKVWVPICGIGVVIGGIVVSIILCNTFFFLCLEYHGYDTKEDIQGRRHGSKEDA